MNPKQPAIVLLGPTGAGKTPLGALFAKKGLNGRRCVHFDFGENLRDVVARAEPDAVVSRQDIALLRRVLESGALLEDREFPIAQRVLASFLQHQGVDSDTIVVMNGLPRHVGQAQALSESLLMLHVICLQCPADVVLQRIASNAGGDRGHRADDDRAAVERKLEIYAQRTAPLVGFFRERGATIIDLRVTATMQAGRNVEPAGGGETRILKGSSGYHPGT